MDTDGFPLAAISERSVADDTLTPVKSKRGKRAPLQPADAVDATGNGDVSSAKLGQPAILDVSAESQARDPMKKYNQVEVSSIPDEDDDDIGGEDKYPPQRVSQRTNDQEATMVSSYTTGGGDNDVIEIHQFSQADVDAYLDIYFETLNSRLRHYVGQGDQLQQFRVAMKNRISRTVAFEHGLDISVSLR